MTTRKKNEPPEIKKCFNFFKKAPQAKQDSSDCRAVTTVSLDTETLARNLDSGDNRYNKKLTWFHFDFFKNSMNAGTCINRSTAFDFRSYSTAFARMNNILRW